jgi:hypothetical protein
MTFCRKISEVHPLRRICAVVVVGMSRVHVQSRKVGVMRGMRGMMAGRWMLVL